ncbi:MAG TPA: DUF11 domain-containing protein, partial [Longimicrobiaceae bacterium]|nr:DUF11 domain-containing protein [Longimicrobiaceae bacterium]
GPVADNVLRLLARSVTQASTRAEGWAEVRRVRPVVTLARSVLPAASSPPGTELTYTLQFGNGGEADAAAVVVTDTLPAQLLFKPGSVQQTLPSGVTATVTYYNGTAWDYVPASGACSAPAGYDGCVRAIRWTLAGILPADVALSAGNFRFVGRIR